MPTRKGKTAAIVSACIVGAVVLYFVGGFIAERAVYRAVFEHRGSASSTLLKLENRIYKQKEDYPALSKWELHYFVSGENTLTGYLYSGGAKGVVLCAHGFSSQSGGPESAYEDYFVRQGYDVFAVDLTASGVSEGSSLVDLSQSAKDVAAAYQYLDAGNLLHGQVVFAGYSWGGYGVAQSLALGARPDKVITFSAYDQPYETMIASAVEKVGGVAYLTIPAFAWSIRTFEGEEAFYRASDTLAEYRVPTLIAHGENDVRIPLKDVSLYSRASGDFVTKYLSEATHLTPWFSKDARDYVETQILPRMQNVNRDSKEDVQAFLSTVDIEKSSELDPELFAAIQTFLG
ncbi:MAG: lysophospholipase [Bacilli bacterium]|nr:lysophospholipase [Bacilli bacterium]